MSENHGTDDARDEVNTEDDSESDPALNDEVGQDWTDEGGATPRGAATNVDPDQDPVDDTEDE